MLAFAVGISLVTSLGFGILSALRVLRVMPQSALQSVSARLTGSRRVARSRGVLVAIQVAASMALLIVTVLITRSFAHVLTQDREFNSAQVVLAKGRPERSSLWAEACIPTRIPARTLPACKETR